MSFTRYSKYKDSGVEWLGDVPEEWDLQRLDAFLKSKSVSREYSVMTFFRSICGTTILPKVH
jgi:hypothetical protein